MSLVSPIAGSRRIEHVMGTTFTFDVRDPRFHEASLDGAVAWLHWVEHTFSTDDPRSELRRLASGTLELDECSDELVEVIDLCVAVEAETEGYFSPLYRGALDPAGLVRGWAVERASEMLVQAGSRAHLINGGGDIRVVGEPAPGRTWRIGVADPAHPGQVVTSVDGVDLAVATSGDDAGERHVLDPHTGAAVASRVRSVTVVGPDLIRADAYATAALAMGERAYAWLASLPDYTGIVVAVDGGVWTTPGTSL